MPSLREASLSETLMRTPTAGCAYAVKALSEQTVVFHKNEFTIYLRKVFILSQKQLWCYY
ncbi:hypothetical protein [Nostoc sp. UCD121]|uniref:hypothetical protein n=1 Tax=Nostoc sp. UCD121 TaxID=2681305 RepID=UPI0016283079|nr:hypothetical protein [Nostoc sp. UCD121]MBC1221948.1 hypothetical protein [Nostoc sp. UCD120]